MSHAGIESTLARVLTVGVRRTDMTWVGQMLRHLESTTFLDEPGNHFAYTNALHPAGSPKGVSPALQRGEEADLKSVYAAPAVEQIVARHPVRVVVIGDMPLNVLSSWSETRWLGRPGDGMLDHPGADVQAELTERCGVPPPRVGASVFAHAAWLIAPLTVEHRAAVSPNRACTVVEPEDLAAPHEGFLACRGVLGRFSLEA